MWLPHDVVMIQQCCCTAMRSAQKKADMDAANKIGKLLGGALSD
jgi:DNA-binding protein YbaB